MADFGGLIKFRLSDGSSPFSLRGNVKHKPSNRSYEKVVNSDGSHSRTVTLEGYEFEMSLEHKAGVDYDAIMELKGVNISFIHDTEGVIRIFGDCSLLGRPEIDAMTGEVTGITGVSRTYREVR
ncbi:hypothetical protein [Microvirga solisilvae]|uniref:hypothetical protein n=1 Tax=Microvirga solisilvae TaxID=2919498 RepID=UPI001FAF69F7|nr:hypothetical protein [Microvirga solisilvae]